MNPSGNNKNPGIDFKRGNATLISQNPIIL
jgi:hypothetical protein